MAHRRGSNTTSTRLRKTESIGGGDDFDFLAASQGSTGSDDHGLQLAVAQQLMASKEKKRKEKERKFLQAAKNKVTADLTVGVPEMTLSSFADSEELYTKFISDYAASEDAIRVLWHEIKATILYSALVANKLHATNDAARIAMEGAMIEGMGTVKAACQENRALVTALYPS
ncbi:hypothetical protein C8F01DRAFT_1147802 [Mycena amicta]|nr:hypothetical protein C8F01DRAFT_1147802 [Mycena amicta]